MNCSECGKKIKNRPRLFHRQTGERVCRGCFNACYHSEAWLKYKDDPEAASGVLTYKDGNGTIKLRCGILPFLQRLFALEERFEPETRFIRRNKETGRLQHKHPVFLGDMLQRLYEYEHPPRCAVCGKPVERVKPCAAYKRRGEVICDECCEKCFITEPFPCTDHDARVREKSEDKTCR